MRAFIKSIDGKEVWKVVLKGWNPPQTPEASWISQENKVGNWKSKALYPIFNGVDSLEFRRSSRNFSRREAWNILETIHKETSIVKMSKVQMLITWFEILKIFVKVNQFLNFTLYFVI